LFNAVQKLKKVTTDNTKKQNTNFKENVRI